MDINISLKEFLISLKLIEFLIEFLSKFNYTYIIMFPLIKSQVFTIYR